MTPRAEVEVSATLVRSLLAEQYPRLADEAIVEVASGWDNVVFRIGETHAARLPRRTVAVELVANEQAWLPILQPRLPLPIPSPVFAGTPGCGYPWEWSVVPWFPGRPMDPLAATAQWSSTALDRLADDLGAFLAALHEPAPVDAPVNPHRGGAIADRTELTTRRIASLHERLIDPRDGVDLRPFVTAEAIDTIAAAWPRRVSQPFTGAPMWLHGDIHPLNVLAEDQALTAVIDFGDIGQGDPACDLGAAWLLLPAAFHERFRGAAATDTRPIDDAMWNRAQAWATNWVLAVLTTSTDAPYLAIAGDALRSLSSGSLSSG